MCCFTPYSRIQCQLLLLCRTRPTCQVTIIQLTSMRFNHSLGTVFLPFQLPGHFRSVCFHVECKFMYHFISSCFTSVEQRIVTPGTGLPRHGLPRIKEATWISQETRRACAPLDLEHPDTVLARAGQGTRTRTIQEQIPCGTHVARQETLDDHI